MGKFEATRERSKSSASNQSDPQLIPINTENSNSASAIKELLLNLKLLRDAKTHLYEATVSAIKRTASDIIKHVQQQEKALLTEVGIHFRHDSANLMKAESNLKKRFDEMSTLKKRVEKSREYTQKSKTSNGYAESLSKQVQGEIDSMLRDGNMMVVNYSNYVDFKPSKDSFRDFGTLSEEPLIEQDIRKWEHKAALKDVKRRRHSSLTNSNNKSESQTKVRRNTVIEPPTITPEPSNQNKARSRSSDDIFQRSRLSLAFTMSNEDLSLSTISNTDTAPITAPTTTKRTKRAAPAIPQVPRITFAVKQSGNDQYQLNDPRDVTFLPNGDICVAEYVNQRLQLFDANGKFKCFLQQVLFRPNGVTTTKDGYVVVTDDMDYNIKAFTRSGELVCKFGTGYFKNPTCIKATTKDFYVLIDNTGSCAWQQCVFLYNSMTGSKLRIGYGENGDYLINNPAYVTVNTRDEIIIADSGLHCIWVFNKHGKCLYKFGTHGEKDGQFHYPKGVCTDKANNIYVADSVNHRICMHNSEGRFVKNVLDGGHGLEYPQVVNVNGSCMVVVQTSGMLCFTI